MPDQNTADPYSVGSVVTATVLGERRECYVIERPDSFVTGSFLLKVKDLDDFGLITRSANDVFKAA
jgi:hypothetical protein